MGQRASQRPLFYALGSEGKSEAPRWCPEGKGSLALAMVLKLRSGFQGKPGDASEKRVCG